MMKILITGGAGFIGSHLVDSLMAGGYEVVVLDNLSSGNLKNIAKCMGNPKMKFIKCDLLAIPETTKALEGCEIVFHLAANPEVRLGSVDPSVHFREHIQATFQLLEAVRKLRDVRRLIFTSSSTVYGEAPTPTREDCISQGPISIYGASKLSCEALITAYARSYGFNALILRLANVIGPRSRHGVIYDFIQKLRRNPRELEILGDGTQRKSHLYVTDCVEALLLGLKDLGGQVEVFNVGSEDQVDIMTIANIVAEEMGLDDVEIKVTGGVDGGRGWIGDVKNMLLDISKIKRYGWRPRFNSLESVRMATKALIEETSSLIGQLTA
jgi:UDP-glucose 4-epimerase